MRAGPTLTLGLLLATAAVAGERTVRVMAIDGTERTGVLRQVAPELTVETGGEDWRLDWSEVLELTPWQPEPAPPAEAHPLWFEMPDGARFGGEIVAAEAGTLTLRIRSGQTVEVAATQARAMLRASRSARAAEAARRLLADAARRTDALVVERDGKVGELSGDLLEIAPTAVRFRYKERSLKIPWDRIAAVLPSPPPPRTAPAEVLLRDGQRFAGRIDGGDGDAVIVEAALLGRIAIAWDHVERIECHSRRVVFLSDAPVLRYEAESLFDKRWEYARNLDLSGNPVVLGGRTYPRALTMHSRARLTFRLGGQFRRFAALVGIIDAMGTRGDAHVAVIGDGQLLWQREHVQGGMPPESVAIDVSDVQELELVVDYGGDLDLSDQVAWVLPRVLR